jgi:hypothetical protein
MLPVFYGNYAFLWQSSTHGKEVKHSSLMLEAWVQEDGIWNRDRKIFSLVVLFAHVPFATEVTSGRCNSEPAQDISMARVGELLYHGVNEP